MVQKRRVEIKAIEDRLKGQATFNKRRQGLFKKTRLLCDSFVAEAAVITFSKAGNVFGFGHPAVDQVLSRYAADPTSAFADYGVQEHVHGGGGGIEKEEEAPPLTEMEKIIGHAMANGLPAWDVTVRNLGLSELDELEAAIGKIKSMVAARAREVAATGGHFAARI
ncbi:hypothetical protein Pfo_025297 [Paulownia fortunei]|nr:hypothetical protein Pfo_025297 [Paulownia fortunei]